MSDLKGQFKLGKVEIHTDSISTFPISTEHHNDCIEIHSYDIDRGIELREVILKAISKYTRVDVEK